MFLSIFDIFKISVGPSSSHTMGPMLAARRFADELAARPLPAGDLALAVSLYGSLAYTGEGHGTFRAVLCGLLGITPESYENVFLSSTRIFMASLVAFLVSQYTDIGVFHLVKRLTHNRLLWLRATGSTAASQLIDTCVIQTLAWVGTPVQPHLPNIILTSYAVKLVAATRSTI